MSSPHHRFMEEGTNISITGTAIPMRNHDGSIMLDHRGKVVYRSQYLSTHPLRSDCKERVGYAGRKLTYVSGEGVIRTMNAAFGHGGWGTEITMERLVHCEQDDQGRWVVGYLATVRVSLRNGISHEDCGSGDGINDNKIKAHEKAIKSAVTDAMKRAARHFGERLGNALYMKGNGIKTAPKDNKTAIIELEKRESLSWFGDQSQLRDQFNENNEDSDDGESKAVSEEQERVKLNSSIEHPSHLSCQPMPGILNQMASTVSSEEEIAMENGAGATGSRVYPNQRFYDASNSRKNATRATSSRSLECHINPVFQTGRNTMLIQSSAAAPGNRNLSGQPRTEPDEENAVPLEGDKVKTCTIQPNVDDADKAETNVSTPNYTLVPASDGCQASSSQENVYTNEILPRVTPSHRTPSGRDLRQQQEPPPHPRYLPLENSIRDMCVRSSYKRQSTGSPGNMHKKAAPARNPYNR